DRRAYEEDDEAPGYQDVKQAGLPVSTAQLLLADGVGEEAPQSFPPVVGALDGLSGAPAPHVVPDAQSKGGRHRGQQQIGHPNVADVPEYLAGGCLVHGSLLSPRGASAPGMLVPPGPTGQARAARWPTAHRRPQRRALMRP